MKKHKRSTFSGKLGFVLSAAGASVGLGNIWRFPYLAAKYGGGIFLLVYIILALTFGYTLIMAETSLGRMTRKSPVGAFESFGNSHFISIGGWINAIIPILIVPYYSVIGGWVIKYLIEYFAGHSKTLAGDAYFTTFISNGWSTEICFIIFTLFTLGIIYAGVRNGIERVSKFMMPILIVLINSFKNKVFINKEPFKLPTKQTWVGIDNFLSAIDKYELLSAVGWTVFITVGSVLVILVCTSMCAWYITRVNSKFTKLLYLLCVFSMVVPFQMVMFTLSLVADRTGLRTPWGIIIIYLGFGAGLAVFMFCGFVKSIPLEIEEAAMIDGCTPLRTFFSVVLPIMKPTYISVGILETMWIWNDFLLPYLVLDLNKYKTISIAIQYMKGSYGRVDMGAVMAALILAVIPVVIFYLACQKHIIKGVAAGAVKG